MNRETLSQRLAAISVMSVFCLLGACAENQDSTEDTAVTTFEDYVPQCGLAC